MLFDRTLSGLRPPASGCLKTKIAFGFYGRIIVTIIDSETRYSNDDSNWPSRRHLAKHTRICPKRQTAQRRRVSIREIIVRSVYGDFVVRKN